MNNNKKNGFFARMLSLTLAFVVTASFIPLLGSDVFAADGADSREPSKAYLVGDDGSETELSSEELASLREASADTELIENGGDLSESIELITGETDENADESPGITDITDDSEAKPEDVSADGPKVDVIGSDEPAPVSAAALSGMFGSRLAAKGAVRAQDVDPASLSTVKIAGVNGLSVTVSGSCDPNYIFSNLFMDGTASSDFVSGDSLGTTGFTATIDMSAFDPGYHTIYYVLRKKDAEEYTSLGTLTYVPRKLTDKPNYKGKFTVYSKYFNFYPFDFGSNTSGNLYMEYKTSKAKKWKRTGYMRANMIQLYSQQGYKIGGLKPGKTYKTRLLYGEYCTYSTSIGGDGKSYFFGGPVLKGKTIKTGMGSKPKVRSLTAKAVNVKYNKVKHYGAYTGVYLYTEKFYTCNIKVTIRLKKKTGAKGMWVNGRFLKGNKKKYTTTFKPYPNYHTKNPRGRAKYKVIISSGQSRSYGGYSPEYRKTRTLR